MKDNDAKILGILISIVFFIFCWILMMAVIGFFVGILALLPVRGGTDFQYLLVALVALIPAFFLTELFYRKTKQWLLRK